MTEKADEEAENRSIAENHEQTNGWPRIVLGVGIIELLFFSMFLSLTAEGLFETADGAAYRLREVLLLGGETFAALAVGLVAYVWRSVYLSAALRLATGFVTIALHFRETWYYLADRDGHALLLLVLAGAQLLVLSVALVTTTRTSKTDEER